MLRHPSTQKAQWPPHGTRNGLTFLRHFWRQSCPQDTEDASGHEGCLSFQGGGKSDLFPSGSPRVGLFPRGQDLGVLVSFLWTRGEGPRQSLVWRELTSEAGEPPYPSHRQIIFHLVFHFLWGGGGVFPQVLRTESCCQSVPVQLSLPLKFNSLEEL